MERNALRDRVIAVIRARSSRRNAAFQDALDYASYHSDVHLIAGTHILELQCDSTDAEVAADYSNVWADEYIKENRESRMLVTQQTEEALRNQLDTVKAKLEQADAALLAYARTSNLLFTGEEHSNVTEERLRSTQQALTEAEKERIAKQAEHELVAAAPKESLPAILEDPAVKEQAKLEQLQSQLADLKTYMAPGHAKIIRIEAQIADLQASMREQRAHLTSGISNRLRPLAAEKICSEKLRRPSSPRLRPGSEDHPVQHPQAGCRYQPHALRISSAKSKRSGRHQGDARGQCTVGGARAAAVETVPAASTRERVDGPDGQPVSWNRIHRSSSARRLQYPSAG